ncbi:MAG: nucleoside deaminase [Waddliaceae bacterium]
MKPVDHEKFMLRAIQLSEMAGIELKTGGAFGAVIVKEGEIISEGYNRVIKECDPTCHAEMDAIRKAGKKLKSPHLVGCVLYTSAYCCPMCLSAAYWAQVEKIYYAAHVEDSKKYGDFKDLEFFEEMRKDPKERQIPMVELMRSEAVEVWKKFAEMPDRHYY